MSLPNLLTLLRILAVLVIAILLVIGGTDLRLAAFVLYVLAAITDFLDGWLARRSNLVSPLGRMLDPIADKLLVAVLIGVLAFDGTLSALDLIPALAILMREVFVSGLREHLGNAGVVLKVTQLAKYKTTIQLVAFGALILVPLLGPLAVVANLLLWLAGVLTVWTGIDYLRGAWPHLTGGQQ